MCTFDLRHNMIILIYSEWTYIALYGEVHSFTPNIYARSIWLFAIIWGFAQTWGLFCCTCWGLYGNGGWLFRLIGAGTGSKYGADGEFWWFWNNLILLICSGRRDKRAITPNKSLLVIFL